MSCKYYPHVAHVTNEFDVTNEFTRKISAEKSEQILIAIIRKIKFHNKQ